MRTKNLTLALLPYILCLMGGVFICIFAGNLFGEMSEMKFSEDSMWETYSTLRKSYELFYRVVLMVSGFVSLVFGAVNIIITLDERS